MPVKTICCIGAGYVGGPTMAVIADRCPDIEVHVVDLNSERIAAWNDPDLARLPIYEPGLDTIVARARGRNLNFSTDVDRCIEKADMVFLSVNTPTKQRGIGAGKASDLRWIEACARQVARNAKGHTIVVEKSTLPVRTAETIKTILNSTQERGKSFSVLSNPEFLAEGTAIKDLEYPDRVLIGGEEEHAIEELKSIYERWVEPAKILETNLWSSELSKLTANALLAQRVSSINSIAALCESTGANVREVAEAVGRDHRIGEKFLKSGPGFGGSCFQKDILNLVYLCRSFGLEEVATYWEQVIDLNTWQQRRISRLITEKLFNTLAGKKIAILGFAFKANTNDTRESPAIRIAKDLIEEGAILSIHDPKVKIDQIRAELGEKLKNDLGEWEFAGSIKDACNNADACILITEWKEYSTINWMEISESMRKPAWLFDTRCIVDSNLARKSGLNVWILGEG
ncbi:UDP-glucose 6-dehydrogenase [Synechococcus sp. Minos11]|nr:nucleotide sugar dehydrogenase [Synechococcus sp. Minos11]QNJ07682.1 UDP-glucose 6-dehydrogenase [Synechococcus sp. Minos11]